ncbi:integral membrane-like protein [Elsinoe australis]|uniref:Integral membrane-like protein n=1 Tax=Elsinoe australis TaxID=40998 RepID=A0A4U7AXA2_9PEZI|nr:integral membrane-like protein [Elsinoe australis]
MITPSNPRAHPLAFGTTLLLVSYSTWHSKLTPTGIATAFVTALLHISFPSPLPFASLVTFFLAGTIATRVGKAVKSGFTVSSTGGSGAEGPRNAVQVLANSGPASLFIVAAFAAPYLGVDVFAGAQGKGKGGDEAVVQRVVFGAACAYAAAAADTLSSELGILAKGSPFLIVPPFRKVPRGTNGGVTVVGLGAGLLGGAVIGGLHFYYHGDVVGAVAIAVLGLGGSVLDSVLGAVLQATVEDKRTGKVVEGANGRRVLAMQSGSRVMRGRDWLNNNGVNFAMTLTMGVSGLVVDGLLR